MMYYAQMSSPEIEEIYQISDKWISHNCLECRDGEGFLFIEDLFDALEAGKWQLEEFETIKFCEEFYGYFLNKGIEGKFEIYTAEDEDGCGNRYLLVVHQ